MLNAWINSFRKKLFDHKVRGVLDTAPAGVRAESGFSILSQLHSPDLLMYLLAAKSFARFAMPRIYYIVDDRLTTKDRELLKQHLEKVSFIPIAEVEMAACPRGGCWERLASIAALNNDSYIVQLDADTLTLRKPSEVMQSIAQYSSFTLGTILGRKLVSAVEASNYAKGNSGKHVQQVAEAALANYPHSDQHYYVRGCAGFAGFAPGTFDLQSLSNFSQEMSGLVGQEKWTEWGSEQFTSNFFIANSVSATVLPYEGYPYMSPETDIEASKLIHFVGSHRFQRGYYSELGKVVVDELHVGV
jgi:hypothetical protein